MLIKGDDEPNRISGTAGGDTIVAGDGNDTVFALGGADLVFGEGGDDLLSGDSGADTLDGGAGDDTVIGGFGDDRIVASTGDDVYRTGGGADTLDYSDVAEDLTISPGGVYTLGNGDVQTVGEFGDGFIDVFATVIANPARTNTLNGTNIVGGVASPVNFTADLATGAIAATVLAPALGFPPGARIEFVARNFDDIVGSTNRDRLSGDSGANEIFADAGNDRVEGRRGADTLRGGDGDDRLGGGRDDDLLEGGLGRDVITGGAGADVFVWTEADAAAQAGAGVVDQVRDLAAADRIEVGAFSATGAEAVAFARAGEKGFAVEDADTLSLSTEGAVFALFDVGPGQFELAA